MAKLTAADRKRMPAKEFGEPKTRGYPMMDAVHQRLAISGATRAEHVGNISHAEAAQIKAKAHALLNHEHKKKTRKKLDDAIGAGMKKAGL